VLAVLFLSIGAGAVFQVVVAIVLQMRRSAESAPSAGGLLSAPNLAGFLAGLAVMYATGLFLAV
jgi:uncharacterized membrane protein